MTDPLTATSKFLAYALRHRPDAVGITLDEGGWIDVDSRRWPGTAAPSPRTCSTS